MSVDDLKKLLDDAALTQAGFDTWWASAATQLILGKWRKFKGDLDMQAIFARLFQLTPIGVVDVIAAVDQAIAQANDAAAKGPDRIALLRKLDSHPGILWGLARLLN